MQETETESPGILPATKRALHRVRLPILAVALTYLVSVGAGIVMVENGNVSAIAFRDTIVNGAQSSPITAAYKAGDLGHAVLLDFAGNLYGAAATTLAGIGVIAPFPIMAYRGWIGGIVSIDNSHASRLAEPREAAYYLITLTLQLIPYILSGGAGVNMGLAYLWPRSFYRGEKWLGIPIESMRDTLRIYLVAVPLFLFASIWEFLAR